jgi:hypothetical protein
MDKATQMSKDLGETTPKIIKQIKIENKIAPAAVVVPKEIANKSLIITSETIEKLINGKKISKDDAYSLSKLTREKLITYIKQNEFSFIKDNIVPDNLIINIVRRLNKEKQAATVVKQVVASSPVVTSPSVASPSVKSLSPSVASNKSPSSVSSISSPSSASSDSKSPVITITDTKSASSVSSDVKKPSIIFPSRK